MHFQISHLILALAPSIVGVSARPSGPSSYKAVSSAEKAVYLLSNEVKNSTATGGAGSNSVDSSTGQAAAPDALASQSALTVAGHSLFAVNAGSNTITIFRIDKKDPTKLQVVGEPVAVPGEFPSTVAASSKNGIVCVGTSGAVAGVSCAPFTKNGIGAMDNLRPFDLRQTTPPVGPTNTVSQVFFSDDQNTLFTTVKGDPTKNNTGFLSSFAVQASNAGGCAASVSQEDRRTSPDGTAVLFGSSVIPGTTDIFVTDASFGGAVLSVDANSGNATVKGKGPVDGQAATCWATVSPATGTAFVTDVGRNRLVEMSTADANIISEIDLSANGDPGLIDLRASGQFIYALSPGNGTTQAAVTVVDATSKKQVQHFQLGNMGAGKNAMGMAVLA
ncbi:hypothetical protein BN1723_007091 [Verticillium longisporum]|uniref:3-carboxymuconate cyclase n=2 Tax=Verticillium longisporum TaxID=100787 RepID=A0A0G4NJ75_VERLO|nr:hypothetical protein BN1708_002415 [Verticillium longisporum]CRK46483.1 hypothetical protein BN1723_007091 [Verticillium longisporum]